MPQRKSEARKLALGTARASRRVTPAANTRLIDVPSPPDALSDGAKSVWADLAPLLVAGGTLTAADLPALALLARTLAAVFEYETIIRAEGATVPTGAGGVRPHPLIVALGPARSLARQMLGDFGLNPRSRQGVDAAPEAPNRDPLASFRKAGLDRFR
jgi:P27 family predicted phage terminase small subunit